MSTAAASMLIYAARLTVTSCVPSSSFCPMCLSAVGRRYFLDKSYQLRDISRMTRCRRLILLEHISSPHPRVGVHDIGLGLKTSLC